MDVFIKCFGDVGLETNSNRLHFVTELDLDKQGLGQDYTTFFFEVRDLLSNLRMSEARRFKFYIQIVHRIIDYPQMGCGLRL